MPEPIMLPTTSAVAVGSPSSRLSEASGAARSSYARFMAPSSVGGQRSALRPLRQ